MRLCPGIVLVNGPTGRKPVLAGAGLEVWEVIRAYRDCGEDFEKTRKPWTGSPLGSSAMPSITGIFTPRKLRRRFVGRRSSKPGPLNFIPISSLGFDGQALSR